MIKIEIKENQIQISSEDKSLENPEFFLRLTLDEGFVEDNIQNFRRGFTEIPDEKNSDDDIEQMRKYEEQCTQIFEIHEFFLEEGEKVELDNEVKILVEFEKKRKEKFENTIEKGTTSKTQISIKKEIAKGVSLMPYQIKSVNHAIGVENSANFSVPGSGKTWMAYATYKKLKEEGLVEKLLVVSPLSAFRPWENEYLEIFGEEPNSYRIKSNKISRLHNYLDEHEIFLVSYKTAANYRENLIHVLKQNKFLMICDESHYIKNPIAERTIAALEIAPYAKCRMVLSGTPMPQSPEDLWSQFTFLYPSQRLLGSFSNYKDNIEVMGFPKIKKILEPIYTRVSLNELDLPEPVYQRTSVEMAPLQRNIYDAIAQTIIKNKDHEIDWRENMELDEWRTNMVVYLLEAAVDPTLLTKEKEAVGLISDYKGMSFPDLIKNYNKIDEIPGKITRVLEEVPKIVDSGQKVVVWSWLVRNINRLEKELKKIGYKSITVTGKVPQDEETDPNDNREKRIEEFKY